MGSGTSKPGKGAKGRSAESPEPEYPDSARAAANRTTSLPKNAVTDYSKKIAGSADNPDLVKAGSFSEFGKQNSRSRLVTAAGISDPSKNRHVQELRSMKKVPPERNRSRGKGAKEWDDASSTLSGISSPLASARSGSPLASRPGTGAMSVMSGASFSGSFGKKTARPGAAITQKQQESGKGYRKKHRETEVKKAGDGHWSDSDEEDLESVRRAKSVNINTLEAQLRSFSGSFKN